jgi:pyridoxine 4-dehydrogenase
VALAWLLHRSPVMLPIPGTKSQGHVEENCQAGTFELTHDQVDSLSKATA